MTTRMATMILLTLSVGLLACGGGEGATSKPDGPLVVVATTGQIADLVREVGGERVEVTALMGPGVDPHLFKASAGDVDRLRGADLIVYNGLHLEAKMGTVLKHMDARRPTLAVAEALPESLLLSPPGYEAAHDPHIWFDVTLWKRTLEPVAAKLAELDRDHAAEFAERAAAYGDRLDDLHAFATHRLSSIPAGQRVLITAHDAFNYLGRAYGLEVRGLQGISTMSEAGTGDVQELAAFIAARRIPAIFVETSVSPRAIEAVQAAVRARGHEVVVGGELYSDALGDPDGSAGTYVGMVRHNVETIADALRGEIGHE